MDICRQPVLIKIAENNINIIRYGTHFAIKQLRANKFNHKIFSAVQETSLAHQFGFLTDKCVNEVIFPFNIVSLFRLIP